MLFTKANHAELQQGYTNRNGFIFTTLTDPANVHDAIVVHVLQSAGCITPQLPHSSRSFAEHLALIQSEGLEKAIVISDEIGWLSQCPSLQFLWVIPSDSAADGFDFSPLYHMPCVKWLRCQTAYATRALELNPHYYHAATDLAMAYYALGDREQKSPYHITEM